MGHPHHHNSTTNITLTDNRWVPPHAASPPSVHRDHAMSLKTYAHMSMSNPDCFSPKLLLSSLPKRGCEHN
jgi:hypothetical protein